jgi:Uma2 family endonuclease
MSHAVRFTIADLELLPETLDDTRYELIDGELHVSKQPHWAHQSVSDAVAAALREWSAQTGLGWAVSAPGVIFTPEDAVAPDVVWMSQERLRRSLDPAGHVHEAPELMVEVLSPGSENIRRDRELKLKLYAREGVAEYWVVDWRARTVEVYRRNAGELRLVTTLTDADELISPLLPGFRLPVARLWDPAIAAE